MLLFLQHKKNNYATQHNCHLRTAQFDILSFHYNIGLSILKEQKVKSTTKKQP